MKNILPFIFLFAATNAFARPCKKSTLETIKAWNQAPAIAMLDGQEGTYAVGTGRQDAFKWRYSLKTGLPVFMNEKTEKPTRIATCVDVRGSDFYEYFPEFGEGSGCVIGWVVNKTFVQIAIKMNERYHVIAAYEGLGDDGSARGRCEIK